MSGMRTTRCLAAALALGIPACTSLTRRAERDVTPSAILDTGIARAGGAAALAAARALIWKGDATVHAGGRTIAIAGRWAVMPPDTALVSTWLAARGPSTTRTMVLAAPSGWMLTEEHFGAIRPNVLANERAAFYLYDVMRLVPLRDSAVSLSTIRADSAGYRGFRARRDGRPDMDLHFDATGRLAHVRYVAPDAVTGLPVMHDAWLEDEIVADGVRWPRRIRITLGGAPYFDLTIRTLRVAPHFSDTLFAGPR